ncbi:hypothetical protein MTR67_040799 [Solanum verrucosum]|uniref:Uncharacterized protein n=1 Tax=Solanum verrucosum TaxID=315347 RepID=A0AAF0ULG9_SOLVR|nr:hypothetical protein MTR67_040799 [Solanum verrucosum]
MLACSATGNPPGPGVPGVPVDISSDRGNTNLITTITNGGGNFDPIISTTSNPYMMLLMPNSQFLMSLSNSSVVAMVKLPIPNVTACPLLPISGTLLAPISIQGSPISIPSNPRGVDYGRLLNLGVGSFSYKI